MAKKKRVKKKPREGISEDKVRSYEEQCKARRKRQSQARELALNKQEQSLTALKSTLKLIKEAAVASVIDDECIARYVDGCLQQATLLEKQQNSIQERLYEAQEKLQKMHDERIYRTAIKKAKLSRGRAGRRPKLGTFVMSAQGQTREVGSHRNSH